MKMMTRIFIVWLMLLTTPFQGLAAAGMLPCAPSTPLLPSHAAPTGVHDHAAMLAAHHAAAEAAAHVDAGHAGHGKPTSGHHCGGGSPCCVGAALAPALPIAQSGPRLTTKLIPPHAAAPLAVDLATPERPPRHSLA